ncbi:MAG: hypothetical protein ACXW0Q_12280 [Methylovulum sp.]
MIIKTVFKFGLLVAVVLFNGMAAAYSPEELEKLCKKPKFTDFNLTEYKKPELAEIPPESELLFKVSPWTDPTTIKLTAKKQPLEFTVETNSSFHKIKAKLPASLNGQFVRINVTAKAITGCDDQDGWLVKIAEK